MNVQRLTDDDNLCSVSVVTTNISVSPEIYPAPVSITFTSINLPPSKIGVRTHPLPSPTMSKFTLDTYPLPGFDTTTLTILPLDIIGST